VEPPSGTWRLLAGWADAGRAETYGEHLARFGPLPLAAYSGAEGRHRLIEVVAASGLRGRGGAAFPTARKLATVAAGRGRAVVVANGCEGEPSSRKDRILAELEPHLVVEGALVAAHATRADEVYLCMHRDSPALTQLAEAAAAHRTRLRVTVVSVPGGFVASEESALVNYLDNDDARPTSKPPRVFESGVKGRPTYVGNFESLAQLALIARFGSQWFRSYGTEASPGTALVTVDGAVRSPGVVEVPYGTTLGEVLDAAGWSAATPGTGSPRRAAPASGSPTRTSPQPGRRSVSDRSSRCRPTPAASSRPPSCWRTWRASRHCSAGRACSG
jgi:NADH:ubiquinone oxidoreductase subunit F (NADH-binding)